MSKKRKRYTAQFKFQVALETAAGLKTINQIASEQGVHPSPVTQWKKQLLQEGPAVFPGLSVTAGNAAMARQQREQEAQEAELYEQIGGSRWSSSAWEKKHPDTVEAKRAMIEPMLPDLSIRRQCELVGLSRSTYYHEAASETPFNLRLMRLIDEQYMRTPFYGYLKRTVHQRRLGYRVNPKRIYRLMRRMGLQAIYARPRATAAGHGHKVYPYLLRGLELTRADQVWAADITYVPMRLGFMYLVAILDWFSRYVIAWQLSNSLDGHFCLQALEHALTCGQPEIFNTDQGAQFTAYDFTGRLEAAGVRISMDGRGRVMDNIFVERLWRTVKYEDIYLKDFASVPVLQAGLADYFRFYNTPPPHQSLGYRVPAEVYFGKEVLLMPEEIHLDLPDSWSNEWG